MKRGFPSNIIYVLNIVMCDLFLTLPRNFWFPTHNWECYKINSNDLCCCARIGFQRIITLVHVICIQLD